MCKDLAVIMSIYRNDKIGFVKQSVESILNQTYKDFDFFIQYDGPIETNVDRYLSQIEDKRIIIHKREENKGLAFSLNELLNIVRAKDYKYIARMDADDISLPTRFEKQLSFFGNHPETDCLGTWAIEITDDGTEYFKKKMPETNKGCLDLFKKRDCLIHPTIMFRSRYFDKAGLYPEDTYFGEDTIMWAQGFKNNCSFANYPEYLFKFRIDKNFFKRRRGYKHAISILKLRHRVNKMLGFGIKEYIYALLYSMAKLMPTPVLNLIYKTSR